MQSVDEAMEVLGASQADTLANTAQSRQAPDGSSEVYSSEGSVIQGTASLRAASSWARASSTSEVRVEEAGPQDSVDSPHALAQALSVVESVRSSAREAPGPGAASLMSHPVDDEDEDGYSVEFEEGLQVRGWTQKLWPVSTCMGMATWDIWS